MNKRAVPVVFVVALLLGACATPTPGKVGKASPPTTTAPEGTAAATTEPATPETSDATATTEGSSPDTSAVAPSSLVDWAPCDDYPDTELECGTLSVPLDYDAPDLSSTEQIDIALIRQPASGRRQGAILTNPGGPGGSGIDFLAGLASQGDDLFGQDVLARYDLVGFDPRGVGASNEIVCVSDAWLDDHLYLDDTPDTPEEQAALDATGTEFNAGCTKNLGASIVEYSTVSTARDMDRIRIALGDDKILYYGASYGSYLGGVYATLFPEHSGPMVLDAAYSPVGDDPVTQLRTQLVGFEEAFGNWAAWCDGEAACPLTGGAAARWDAQVVALDQAALDVGGRAVNETVLRQATVAALYSRVLWSPLAKAIAASEKGDGSGLLRLADSYSQRAPDGSYTNLNEANTVIGCASGFSSGTVADPAAAVAEVLAAAPRFAAGLTVADLEDDCATLTGAIEPQAISADGSIPILVIGGTNDPATPFRWAEKMTGELNARLMTFTGEGHGAFGESTCIAAAVQALFVDATLPSPGASCEADPPATAPDWWADQPVPDGVTPLDFEDAAGLIGLPAGNYADLLSTALEPQAAIDAFIAAYEAAGWSTLGTADLPNSDSKQAAFGLQGDVVAVTVLSAAETSAEDLGPLNGEVPADNGLVLRFVLPQ